MKRDMELCRKILFAIEEQYVDVAIHNLRIEGYTVEQVAYHCKILHEAGFISDYGAQYADGHIYVFGVGSLTWDGNEFLDKIREDTVWNKTKGIVKEKVLPMSLNVIKDIATAVISSMTEAAIKGISG